MRSRYPAQGSTLEYYLWLFVRLSAAFMLLAGAIGLAYANLNGRNELDAAGQYRWSFVPLYWHVQNSVPEVAPIWSNSLLRVSCLILVGVAAIHGTNGFLVILEDYIHHPITLLFAKGLVFILLLFMLGTGISIIFGLF